MSPVFTIRNTGVVSYAIVELDARIYKDLYCEGVLQRNPAAFKDNQAIKAYLIVKIKDKLREARAGVDWLPLIRVSDPSPLDRAHPLRRDISE
jgi:hypothetical protein